MEKGKAKAMIQEAVGYFDSELVEYVIGEDRSMCLARKDFKDASIQGKVATILVKNAINEMKILGAARSIDVFERTVPVLDPLGVNWPRTNYKWVLGTLTIADKSMFNIPEAIKLLALIDCALEDPVFTSCIPTYLDRFTRRCIDLE